MLNKKENTCPLCGGDIKTDDNSKLLYGTYVCRTCSNRFANRREWAFLFDLFILCLCGAVILSILESAGDIIQLMASLAFLLKDGFRGSSPGKAIMGLQVIDTESQKPAGFWASFKRNLPILIIPGLPIVIYFQLVWGYRTGYRTGDVWAHTRVIWKKYRDKLPFAIAGTKGSTGFDDNL